MSGMSVSRAGNWCEVVRKRRFAMHVPRKCQVLYRQGVVLISREGSMAAGRRQASVELP